MIGSDVDPHPPCSGARVIKCNIIGELSFAFLTARGVRNDIHFQLSLSTFSFFALYVLPVTFNFDFLFLQVLPHGSEYIFIFALPTVHFPFPLPIFRFSLFTCHFRIRMKKWEWHDFCV